MRWTVLGAALGGCLWLPVAAAQTEPTRLRMFGLTATIDVPSSATGGQVAVVSVAVPPSGGPPAHRHSREDEVFVIKAGSYRFLMDGVCIDAGPGDTVFMPRGHVHRFANTGATAAEHTLIMVPGGLEQSFVDFAAMDLSLPRDLPRLNDLSKAKYGLEFLPGHEFRPAECRPANAGAGAGRH